MKVEYRCKFCHRPGVVEIPEEDTKITDEMFRMERWIPLLTCNRCADYLVAKRQTIDAILYACRELEVAPESKREKALAKSRNSLTSLTKRFYFIVCNYYRKPNQWNAELLELLIEHPRRAYDTLSRAVRIIEETPTQQIGASA